MKRPLRFVASLPRVALWLGVAGALLAAPLRAQTSPKAGLPSTAPVPDLEAYLDAHPRIASAMVCEFPGVTLSHRDWSPAEKKYLRDAFARAWRGEPTGLPDPLPNAFVQKDDEHARQGLAEQDALQLYFATIAWSLAFEMQHVVTWTLLEYTPEELAVIFDSRQMFQLVKGSKAPAIYEVNVMLSGRCLPAPPEVSVAFIRRHALFGGNKIGTVSHTLAWCEGLSHFTGNDSVANMRTQWQYEGFPPVSRIIAGSHYDDGKGHPSAQVSHFTAGCHGTTGFLRAVLRNINIPVENVHVGGHSLPYFPTLDDCLTHGDDPYNLLFRSNSPAILPNLLMIKPDRFDELFGPKVDPKVAVSNVGIRTQELALEHLPLTLLTHYLDDQTKGKDHAGGQVAQSLSKMGTPAQLEARNLWSRMDARIAELGGPDKVRALEKELAARITNHTAD